MTRAVRVVGGVGLGRFGEGGESQAPSLFDRLVQTRETLHAVYLSTLSVCTYHIKNHKCQEKSQKNAPFLPLTLPELLRLIYAAQRSRRREKKYTLSCVSHQVPLSLSLLPLMIGSDTFKLLCTQIHMSTWA